MKTILLTLTSLLISTAIFAHADGPGVTKAKAIELSAHRVDRLVTLKKIDASFLKKLSSIEVIVVENQAPVYYKTRVSQTMPAEGNPMQLEISLDEDGKPLAFQVIPNGVAGPDMAWPDKNSVELTEQALHYVLENTSDAKIVPFNTEATTVTLSKAVLEKQTVVLGQVSSSATTDKLNVYLKFDGSFISAEVVK